MTKLSNHKKLEEKRRECNMYKRLYEEQEQQMLKQMGESTKNQLKPLLQHQAEDMLMSFHSIICIPYFDEREKSLEELKQRYVTSNSANKKVKNDS